MSNFSRFDFLGRKFYMVFLLSFIFMGSLQEVKASFASPNCKAIVQQLLRTSDTPGDKLVRQSFGFSDQTGTQGRNHIQFGFESEYGLNEIDGIVQYYGPSRDFGISRDDWFNRSVAERAEWVRQNVDSLFPENRQNGKLVLLRNEREMDFLPEALIRDDTGNLEFILKPFDTYEEWYRAVSRINEKFGEGSMQGTVSVPTDSFFGRVGNVDPNTVLSEKKGFFNFYLDYDILQKLAAGARRFDENAPRRVTRNFEHPFLGPTTRKKQQILHSMLEGNAIGTKYEAERLERIASWENSFKYVGGTVYRPDILGERRVILEVRDAHKNFTLLNDRMLRATYYMQEGTEGLDALSRLRHFDAISDFERLPQNVQEDLKRLFPNKANPAHEYDPEIKRSLDVFRNFSYPLRDWSDHLDALGVRSLAEQVQRAQDSYLQKLSEVSRRLRQSQIDEEEAAARVQGALAQFAEESGLARAFEGFEERLLNPASRPSSEAVDSTTARRPFEQFVREATVEAGPLQDAFPETVWRGKLVDRMNTLMDEFPDQIGKVENVRFNFKGREGGQRNLYIINTNGLNSSQQEKFIKAYVQAVSENSISFPIKSKQGHLYSRVGSKTFDFYNGLRTKDYRLLGTEKKIETFIELDSREFLNLRTYIDNAKSNTQETIGRFSMQGSRGDTARRLDNNLPVSGSEGHNCTSWICMAPIGQNGKLLHEIAGAPISHEVHTSPAWWSAWLTNYGGRERVPFSVYFTEESLSDVVARIQREGKLEWIFGERN